MTHHIIKEKGLTTLLLLLALLLESQLTYACTRECSVTEQSCLVCFESCQNQPHQYSFYNCSQEQFSPQNTQSPQNETSQTTIFIYNENQCSSKCCSSTLSRFQIAKFYSCSDNQRIARIQAIVIGCVITAIVVSVCICCCNKSIRQKIVMCCCMDALKKVDDKHCNESKQNMDPYLQNVSKTHLEGVQASQMVEKVCPFCLQTSCNVSTTCKHCFHLKCLRQSYKKNLNCPACNSTQLDSLAIYCDCCHKPLNQQIRLSILFKYGLNIGQKIICSKCKEDV